MPVPLSVVVPAYNEANRIPRTLERMAAWKPAAFGPVEIIIVDDGSKDDTCAVVEAHLSKDNRMRLIKATHGGAMHALITGYNAAKFAWVGNMEADCATAPEEFDRFVPLLGKVDVVNGSRIRRGGLPPIEGKSLGRRILSKGMSTLFLTLFRCGVADPQIGFKIYKKDALNETLPLLRANHDGIKCAELVALAFARGHDVTEVPVIYHHDEDSRLVPKNPLGVATRALLALLRTWITASRQYRAGALKRAPTRFGAVASAIGTIFGIK